MNIHVSNMTSKSWAVVRVIKVRQLFNKVSKIDSSVWWNAVQTEKM